MSNATSLLEPPTMGKRVKDDPSERVTVSVRIDADLAEKIELITARRRKPDGKKMSTADYLSPIVRAQVEADYAAEIEAAHRQLKQRQK